MTYLYEFLIFSLTFLIIGAILAKISDYIGFFLYRIVGNEYTFRFISPYPIRVLLTFIVYIYIHKKFYDDYWIIMPIIYFIIKLS